MSQVSDARTVDVRSQTSRSSRRDDSAVKAGFGDNVNLNGWVSTRVVNRACVDLGDGHSIVSIPLVVAFLVFCARGRFKADSVNKLSHCSQLTPKSEIGGPESRKEISDRCRLFPRSFH